MSVQMIDRSRRFSMSSVGYHGLHSPNALLKTPSRLDQLRHEESIPQSDREVAHEKETQSTMQISHTWDELSLDDADSVAAAAETKRPKSFAEPLHVFTSTYPYASSPSPTRGVGKQCYSPSLQQAVRNYTLTPSPSPSPTRKSFVRRSISPIVLRPSPLSAVKRKIEIESQDGYAGYSASPMKKPRAGSFSCSSSLVDNLHSPYHPLLHSVSSSVSCGGSVESSSTSEEPLSDTVVSMDDTSSWSTTEDQPPAPLPPSRFSLSNTQLFTGVRSFYAKHDRPSSASGLSPHTSRFVFRPLRLSVDSMEGVARSGEGGPSSDEGGAYTDMMSTMTDAKVPAEYNGVIARPSPAKPMQQP